MKNETEMYGETNINPNAFLILDDSLFLIVGQKMQHKKLSKILSVARNKDS